MRISDWSSDVCSSDLSGREGPVQVNARVDVNVTTPVQMTKLLDGVEYMQLYNEARITRDPVLGAYYSQQQIQSTIDGVDPMLFPNEIGRASCRERVCQYV